MVNPLCAEVGGDLWDGDNRSDRTDAATVCWACPLRRECLAEAEAARTATYTGAEAPMRPYGVWGAFMFYGTTEPPRQLGPYTREQRQQHHRDRRRR